MNIFPGGRKCKTQKAQFGDAGTPISTCKVVLSTGMVVKSRTSGLMDVMWF